MIAFQPSQPVEGKGAVSILGAPTIDADARFPIVTLLFAAGARPCAADIARLAQADGGFSLSFEPSSQSAAQGWVELLASGLTFDCTGLAPAAPAPSSPGAHWFGLPPDFNAQGLEAIALAPGPHLAGGERMFPVLRGLATVAARLAALDGVRAVAWHPARALSEPGFFRRGVLGWIEGGVFPVLGLAALAPAADGGLQSEGLALFTGQEVLLPADVAASREDLGKIALRLINWLVEHGEIREPMQFTGPTGEPLGLEPVENARILRVWRGSL